MLCESLLEASPKMYSAEEMLALLDKEKAEVSPLPDTDWVKSALSPSIDKKDQYVEVFLGQLIPDLCRYSVVGPELEEALDYSAREVALTVIDGKKIRRAICLDTGLGKSTFVRYAYKAAKDLGYQFPICICVETVRELRETYGKLKDLGVTNIALDFSAGYARPKFQPTDEKDWKECEVLLCCHAVADLTKGDWEKRMTTRWGDRTVFYDEALRKGEVNTFYLKRLQSEWGMLSPYIHGDLKGWIDGAIDLLSKASGDVCVGVAPDNAVKQIEDAELSYREDGTDTRFGHLKSFVKPGHSTVKKIGLAFYSFVEKLPYMPSLFVLDANHLHSPLSTLDKSIEAIPFPAPTIKWYHNVLIKPYGGSGGKFGTRKSKKPKLKLLNDILLTLESEGKKCLVLCSQEFEKEVKAQGADNVLTWGVHTGTNDYSEFDNVIVFNTYWLANSTTTGYVDLYGGKVEKANIEEVAEQQMVLDFYQGVSRSITRRNTVDAEGITQALPCTIHLLGSFNKRELDYLDKVMPGIQYEKGKWAEVKRYLAGYKGKLSSKKVIKDCGLSEWDWESRVKPLMEKHYPRAGKRSYYIG
jgi:hypothetical protein